MAKDKKENLQEGYQPKEEILILKRGYQPQNAEDSSTYKPPEGGTAAKTPKNERSKK